MTILAFGFHSAEARGLQFCNHNIFTQHTSEKAEDTGTGNFKSDAGTVNLKEE